MKLKKIRSEDEVLMYGRISRSKLRLNAYKCLYVEKVLEDLSFKVIEKKECLELMVVDKV